MANKLMIFLQSIIPHHFISRVVGMLAHSKKAWVKNTFINWFVKQYHVDMSTAVVSDPLQYESFNAFFTRQLKPECRPIDQQLNSIVSPADGMISQFGEITQGSLIQAKGMNFALEKLLGGDKQHASHYHDGKFMTIYLSPKDYHRVHMPISGVLEEMVYVPGRIFSVNQFSTEHIPNLFARNERVVCRFSTEYGMMTMILVGAMIVASIKTSWAGIVAPYTTKTVKKWDYPEKNIILKKGEEMGCFQLGSTVILLLESQAIWHENLAMNAVVKLGQTIGINTHVNSR